jgi:hypothetical protein
MHRTRYYAPILHKGRAQQTGTKAEGARQQKCSKDWTDSDEYLRVTMRWGLKKEDRMRQAQACQLTLKMVKEERHRVWQPEAEAWWRR